MTEQRKAVTITITKLPLWATQMHIKTHSHTLETYIHENGHTHTHTNWPHLDLLLQEVDFVLLLQKLLLLPGNLRTKRTTHY